MRFNYDEPRNICPEKNITCTDADHHSPSDNHDPSRRELDVIITCLDRS